MTWWRGRKGNEEEKVPFPASPPPGPCEGEGDAEPEASHSLRRHPPLSKAVAMDAYYIFSYYLIQFCGHSWIFTNMIIRFMSFGEDSVADTFYSIGLVMRICQSLSILELLHILLGIENDRFVPRLLQITERIIILFVVIASQEEVQGKSVVCLIFFLWSLLDVVRYTYCMLAAMGIHFQGLTRLSYVLWILLYPLSVLAEAFAIYESLPYFETSGTYSIKLPLPFAVPIYFPYVLKVYMATLFGGMYFIVQHLDAEWKAHLRCCDGKPKSS